jgi:hypothetical protein
MPPAAPAAPAAPAPGARPMDEPRQPDASTPAQPDTEIWRPPTAATTGPTATREPTIGPPAGQAVRPPHKAALPGMEAGMEEGGKAAAEEGRKTAAEEGGKAVAEEGRKTAAEEGGKTAAEGDQKDGDDTGA